MQQKNIRLLEAMTQSNDCQVRAWEVYGLHIDANNLPANAKVKKTFVFKFSEDQWQVGVEYTVEYNQKPEMVSIDEFSTLKDLQKKYPQLFKLEGDLYALS